MRICCCGYQKYFVSWSFIFLRKRFFQSFVLWVSEEMMNGYCCSSQHYHNILFSKDALTFFRWYYPVTWYHYARKIPYILFFKDALTFSRWYYLVTWYDYARKISYHRTSSSFSLPPGFPTTSKWGSCSGGGCKTKRWETYVHMRVCMFVRV